MVRNDIKGEVVTITTTMAKARTLPTPAVQVSRRCRDDTVNRRYSARSAFLRARDALRADFCVADFALERRGFFFDGGAVSAKGAPNPLGLEGVAIGLSHSRD